jgi:predicted TIM-barrel fold metal-dependent hydrolase
VVELARVCSSAERRLRPSCGRLKPVRPLDLGPRSSDEYEPLPPSPVVVEAARRARDAMEVLVRRGAVSRRELLVSAAASAAVLSALSACAGESRASRGAPAPGGTFEVPASSTTSAASVEPTIDPAAASTVLDRGDAIMDVQLHFLDPDRNTAGIGAGFPQASCGPEPRLCFSQDVFLDLVFGQSDTGIGVLSGLPLAGHDTPLSLDIMERARERLAEQGGDRRLLLQAPVFPATGPLDAALEGMAADAATYQVAAWKTYTHTPHPYRLDDERGDALLAQAVALGRPILAVHKGISGEAPASSPVDVGPAAKAHPDATIVVYHSGWEPGTPEGAYAADAPAEQLRGVDRLIASLRAAGIRPGGNVYAELGSTWFNLARDPDAAAHVLGKLLVELGPERILWGTDSIWYGSPQGQIDAFRAFAISEQFQEAYGYPPLNDGAKRLILGGNAIRLYGLT